MLVIGSTQKNCALMNNMCPTLTSAMGGGGGNIPMIVEIYEISDNTEMW